MLNTTLSQVRVVARGGLVSQIPKRRISFEDRGRMRCPLKTEPFTADLMPLPKKDTRSTEEIILETQHPEFNKNMQLPSAQRANATRFDDIYFKALKGSGHQRRYTQTWVEGPKPEMKQSLIDVLQDQENIDPVPIERRSKDERPITAKAQNREFHTWFQKLSKTMQI